MVTSALSLALVMVGHPLNSQRLSRSNIHHEVRPDAPIGHGSRKALGTVTEGLRRSRPKRWRDALPRGPPQRLERPMQIGDFHGAQIRAAPDRGASSQHMIEPDCAGMAHRGEQAFSAYGSNERLETAALKPASPNKYAVMSGFGGVRQLVYMSWPARADGPCCSRHRSHRIARRGGPSRIEPDL